MCGLVGLIDAAGRLRPQARCAVVGAMRDCVVHRGPDEAGLLDLDELGCTLGHQRLQVIDLSDAGSQPMRSACGRFVLSYNGEVYNTDELRDRLGEIVRWRGRCDTEVVLEYLARFGIESIGDLNGMFALALIDLKERTLTLARDRFGQKPVYYAWGSNWFAFSSELSALAHVPWFDSAIDRDSVASYLLLQYVPSLETIYRGATKLPPGCTLRVRLDGNGAALRVGEPSRFFEWHPIEPAGGGRRASMEDAVSEFESLLDRAVARRMVSDVPLGVFLSGGIDSALVADAMVRTSGADVHSFSIGFSGSDESEHAAAREAARTIGTVHHDEVIEPDVTDLLPQIASHLDEPLGDSGALPMWCLAKMTRGFVTVALSGDGGDELMGGYERYLETLRESAFAWRRWRWRLRTGRGYDAGNAYCSERFWMIMPDAIGRLMGGVGERMMARAEAMRRVVSHSGKPLIHRMRDVDANTYLPGAVLTKVDRMTMAHSLEARSPFLDPAIAAFASQLPARWCATAWELKRLLRAVVRKRLPASWSRRPKRGFGLPGGGWSRSDLVAMCDELLCGGDARCTSVLDASELGRWVDWQRDERRFSVFQVWTMLMLELWWRAHEKKAKPETPIVSAARLGTESSVSSTAK